MDYQHIGSYFQRSSSGPFSAHARIKPEVKNERAADRKNGAHHHARAEPDHDKNNKRAKATGYPYFKAEDAVPVKGEAEEKEDPDVAVESESDDGEEKPEEFTLSDEQREAAIQVLHNRDNAFLTGAAGTGKSYLLRYIIAKIKAGRKRNHGLYVTATTGVAAENIKGTTLHSYAGIGLGNAPKDALLEIVMGKPHAVKRLQNTKHLVIDEVSMLHAELFDKLEFIARSVRKSEKPFGGIQLILCGDFFQLPPVDKRQGVPRYAFQSATWETCGIKTITLKKVLRQTDNTFVSLLNEIRLGNFSERACRLLEACHVMLKVIPDDGILPTRLYCLNRNVDEENQHHLNLLPGPDFTYTGREHWKKRGSVQATGLYDTETEARERVAGMLDRTAPLQIRLRVGAQVMYMKNKPDLGLVNGSRGVVVSCTDASPTVKFDNGLQIAVAEEETAQGCAEGLLVRKFMPLKLAWAMTVHKSQGMTLTRVELQLDNAFEVGQVYVALSRVKSLEGLYIRGRNVTAALVCADREVLARFGHSAPGSAAPAGARRDNSASSSGADRKVPREWLEGPFSYSPVKAPEPTLPHPAPREAPAKFDAHMQFKDVPPPAPAVQPSNARPFVHPFTTGAARSAEPQVIDLISPPVPVKHEVQGAAGSSNSTRAVPSTSFFEQLVANNVRAAPPPAASTKPLTAKVEAIDLRSPTSVPAPVAQRNAAAAALMMPAAAKAAPPAAIPKAVLYFDGGSLGNPGVGGAGYLLYPDGQAAMGAPHLVNFAGVPCAAQAAVRMDGVCTNNQAEYTGLIHGLHCAALRGVRELTVYGDSELVVKQMRGEYKVKNPVLQEMKTRAAALADKFPKVTFHWIERAKNTKADELSKRAMCKRDTAEEAADWFVARK